MLCEHQEPINNLAVPQHFIDSTVVSVARNSTFQPRSVAPSSALVFVGVVGSAWTRFIALDELSADEVAVVVLSSFSVLCFIGMFVTQDGSIAQKLQEMTDKRVEFQRRFLELTAEVETLLGDMAECAGTLAERNLESKRREFVRFLNHFRRDRCEANESLLNPMRSFLLRWLTVFEGCSFDPVEHPKIVVSEEDLKRCSSTVECVDLVHDRLNEDKVEFISSMLAMAESLDNPLSKKDEVARMAEHGMEPGGSHGAGSGCLWVQCHLCGGERVGESLKRPGSCWPINLRFGCCTVTLLTLKHVALIASFFEALFFVAVEAFMLKSLFAIMAFLSAVCIVPVLVRYEASDQLAMLEAQVRFLEEENQAVRARVHEMLELDNKVHNLTGLWRLRTIPILDLMTELFERFRDTSDDKLEHFVQSAADHLDVLERSLGPVNGWCGSDDEVAPNEVLTFVQKQIVSTKNIIKNLHKRLDAEANRTIVRGIANTIRFVGIRVLKALNLRNADAWVPGDLSDPFVRVCVGSEAEWHKTATIQDCLNPIWVGQEFILPIPVEDDEPVVHFEVNDYDGCTSNDLLGNMDVLVANFAPGEWHHRREKLKAPPRAAPTKGKNQKTDVAWQGELEVDIQYATNVSHFVAMVRTLPEASPMYEVFYGDKKVATMRNPEKDTVSKKKIGCNPT